MKSTDIVIKRTKENYDTVISNNEPLEFGMPFLIANEEIDDGFCNNYLAIGGRDNNPTDVSDNFGGVGQSPIFKGLHKDKADNLAFGTVDKDGITDERGNQLAVSRITPTPISSLGSGSTKYHILCQPNDGSGNVAVFNLEDFGIYITENGVMHGGAWNDYAENRKLADGVVAESGMIVSENGDGTLSPSTERLQSCSYVVSDTYGQTIGDGDVSVGVMGRCLVQIDEDCKVGDCVCAGNNGKASVMSRNEVMAFPDRIIGIVSEIPTYDSWNNVEVNDRVWIKIK